MHSLTEMPLFFEFRSNMTGWEISRFFLFIIKYTRAHFNLKIHPKVLASTDIDNKRWRVRDLTFKTSKNIRNIIIDFGYFWCTQLALGSRKNVNSSFHIFKRFDSGWSPHQWEFISIKNTKEENLKIARLTDKHCGKTLYKRIASVKI